MFNMLNLKISNSNSVLTISTLPFVLRTMRTCTKRFKRVFVAN